MTKPWCVHTHCADGYEARAQGHVFVWTHHANIRWCGCMLVRSAQGGLMIYSLTGSKTAMLNQHLTPHATQAASHTIVISGVINGWKKSIINIRHVAVTYWLMKRRSNFSYSSTSPSVLFLIYHSSLPKMIFYSIRDNTLFFLSVHGYS